MTKTISEILFAAADLIEPEGAWTKGELARDSEGVEIRPDSPMAVCWCISGALLRIAPDNPLLEYRTLEQLIGVYPFWNDTPERTQAEVVAKLREAAMKAREQGQ